MDKKYLELVDHMGSDQRIVDAARVSKEGGVREGIPSAKRDAKLIKYLIDNQHWSPFEHCCATFLVRAPIFVARQWLRHKSHSFNEVSGRYSSDIYNEFFLPSANRLMTQGSEDSRQGSGRVEDGAVANHVHERIKIFNRQTHELYNEFIRDGVSEELARTILPLGTYTQFYDTCSLRSWIHFLNLRKDNHAQLEIREYANAVENILREIYPMTMEAAFGKN